MRIKGLLQGIAVIATAIVAWSGAGSANASADIGINAVRVDTEEQQVIVTPKASDKEVLFGIAKKGYNRKTGKTIFKVTAWDVHDTNGTGEVKIDLSKLNATKENFIAVMTGDMDKPFIIKIPAADKVNILTYNAEKHELDYKAGISRRDAIAVKSFEYRIPGGKWSEPQEMDNGVKKDIFEEYQYQGASLYIRTCAKNETELKPDTYYSNVYDANNLDNKLEVYVSGTLPGKIAKLNIAKQANGPAVSVQYTAGTLTLPKAAEYRVLIKDQNNVYSFKEFDVMENGQVTGKETVVLTNASSVTKGVRIDTILGTESNPATSGAAGILEIRTKAKENSSSPKKARCASKWTRINLEITAPLTDDELGGAAIIATSSVVGEAVSGGAGIVNAIIVDDGRKVVSVQYGDSSKGTDGKWKGTIRFTNIGSDDYQIIASAEEVTDVTKLQTGAKVLAAGNVSTKIVNLTNVEDGSYIYIRKAGNQSQKKWVGVYRLFGRADIPKK
ncbi:MAG: hypothetical protein HFH68_00685 [Lachnospiraceae bacterium]|nr:hypothetical protein [Lachnospiraceae bacterium]